MTARMAPAVKKVFHTVLSARNCVDENRAMPEHDSALAGCLTV